MTRHIDDEHRVGGEQPRHEIVVLPNVRRGNPLTLVREAQARMGLLLEFQQGKTEDRERKQGAWRS